MTPASVNPAPAVANNVVSADGTRIAFDRSGNGQPVVLVDGAFCSRTLGPMATLAPLLARDFTVFAYDRRGRGDSEDTAPYAIEREIEDLQAVISVAGGSAHIFGMSSGAILALDAAARGLAIRKLALYEPPFVVDPAQLDGPAQEPHAIGAGGRSVDTASRHIGSGQAPPADATAQLDAMIAAGRRSDAVAYFMKLMGMPAIALAVMRCLPMWSRLKAVAHTLPYDSAIVGDGSLPTQRVASVAVPTIVIAGEKSPARLRNAVRAVAATIPRAQQRLLQGQDHNVSTKALAPVLEQFFRM
ncbi:MAG: alpha/beta hydrolase [Candidatus Elarobacter sp.]